MVNVYKNMDNCFNLSLNNINYSLLDNNELHNILDSDNLNETLTPQTEVANLLISWNFSSEIVKRFTGEQKNKKKL